jgi:hypothetical protein
MWKWLEDWESIGSEPLGESQAYWLEFVDEPMLLVFVAGESSTDLEPQSIAPMREDSIQSLSLKPE